MKKDSCDDDLDVEAHICRLIRDMEDFRDGKGTGIWRKSGDSSSLLPSLLYLYSVIAPDDVTYTLLIQAMVDGRIEGKAVSALEILRGIMSAKNR